MFALSRCDYHNDDHPDNQHVLSSLLLVDKWSCFCHQFLCQCKTLVSAQEMKMWTSFWCNSISPLSIFIMAGCGDDTDSDTVFLKRTIMMILTTCYWYSVQPDHPDLKRLIWNNGFSPRRSWESIIVSGVHQDSKEAGWSAFAQNMLGGAGWVA